MDESIRQKLNRVYGKGFYDGMKATQKEQEQPMNEARFNSLYKGLNDQSKRVYQAVPIQAKWSVSQIIAEIVRVSPSKNDHRSVLFCLNALKNAGLIKESSTGMWSRVTVRAKVCEPAESIEEVETKAEEITMPTSDTKKTDAVTEKTTETALDRIGELSSQVITIIQSLHKLAADIDAAAIEVEEQIEKINKDSIRLKKLQEIFKDLQG